MMLNATQPKTLQQLERAERLIRLKKTLPREPSIRARFDVSHKIGQRPWPELETRTPSAPRSSFVLGFDDSSKRFIGSGGVCSQRPYGGNLEDWKVEMAATRAVRHRVQDLNARVAQGTVLVDPVDSTGFQPTLEPNKIRPTEAERRDARAQIPASARADHVSQLIAGTAKLESAVSLSNSTFIRHPASASDLASLRKARESAQNTGSQSHMPLGTAYWGKEMPPHPKNLEASVVDGASSHLPASHARAAKLDMQRNHFHFGPEGNGYTTEARAANAVGDEQMRAPFPASVLRVPPSAFGSGARSLSLVHDEAYL